jgi:type IV pilus assembly protein PilY1
MDAKLVLQWTGAILLGTAIGVHSSADDTEAYLSVNSGDKDPKVLIIFDNSGSMNGAISGGRKIDVAKSVIKGVIDDNPNVDFGLMAFNENSPSSSLGYCPWWRCGASGGPSNGGRVVARIDDVNDGRRARLKRIVDGLNADTNTPLCETTYEAYRYFYGDSVLYGTQNSTSVPPPRDTSAEHAGKYKSPFYDPIYTNGKKVACEQAYVVLMTDGQPTVDTDCDSYVDKLTGKAGSGNRLDEIAEYMYNHDMDGDPSNDEQRVVTYTIGFATDHALLKSTALKGGGQYYTAKDAAELKQKFAEVLGSISATSVTYAEPSIGASSFNSQRSLDYVYYAMFKPNKSPQWKGNLKKYKISGTSLVDAKGVPLFDTSSGQIKTSAQSFWSASPDGNEVASGGVGAKLVQAGPAARNIWVNSGEKGKLEPFNPTNAHLDPKEFGAGSLDERDQLIDWSRGMDVDDLDGDSNTTESRDWVMGDPIHSQPLVVNYGARGGHTRVNPDVRILVGTNAGFIHMFKGDSGDEAWAFFPRELAPILHTLRNNDSASTHPYGVDSTPVVYIHDENGDGTISGSADKVYLYFGLRRGGRSIYALDVTDPDHPSFKWKIDNTMAGFTELGHTWSVPTVTTVSMSGKAVPALIFAGGYDPAKDAKGAVGNDTQGRGIFVVEAETGALIWSVTAGPSRHLQETGMKDSMPAPVAIFDTNNDGQTDRLYVADTGGNVWRADLYSDAIKNWTVHQIASLGRHSSAAPEDDRRFFSRIDVLRSRYNDEPYEALLLGSGNRADPQGSTVRNRFYMLKDRVTRTKNYASDCRSSIDCAKKPAVIAEASLYDATPNTVQEGDKTAQSAAVKSLAGKGGWLIELPDAGEKSLGTSLTSEGNVFFTTYVPSADDNNSCTVATGKSKLWAVSLHTAAAVRDWGVVDGSLTQADRVKTQSVPDRDGLPRDLAVHVGDEGKVKVLGNGDPNDTETSLRTQSTYWFLKE